MELYNADCLEKMKDLSANSIDLFICDLPYGCLTGGGGAEKKARKEKGSDDIIAGCDWDIKLDLDKFWEQVKRLAKNEHTPIIHFCNTRFGYDLIKSNEKWFRYDLVWEKSNAVGFLAANKQPLRAHENIYVFSKAGAYYNRIDISGNYPDTNKGERGWKNSVYPGIGNTPKVSNEGKRCMRSVFEFSNGKAKGGHPTAKPIELYKFLIERYCPVGGVVLDPTFGSCNSGAACKELKRKFIGIEKDKGFFDKANSRFK